MGSSKKETRKGQTQQVLNIGNFIKGNRIYKFKCSREVLCDFM